jgi:hypothetical protein
MRRRKKKEEKKRRREQEKKRRREEGKKGRREEEKKRINQPGRLHATLLQDLLMKRGKRKQRERGDMAVGVSTCKGG